jgi:hypothetical protein
MDLKKINKILDTKYEHVFYRNKELKPLMQKTISKVEKAIIENVKPPKSDKKVYLVSLKYNPDSEKRKLIISCGQFTITPKLVLVKGKNDDSFTIVYSPEELKKYKFDLDHIKKIINKIKKDELDISVSFINITEILE